MVRVFKIKFPNFQQIGEFFKKLDCWRSAKKKRVFLGPRLAIYFKIQNDPLFKLISKKAYIKMLIFPTLNNIIVLTMLFFTL